MSERERLLRKLRALVELMSPLAAQLHTLVDELNEIDDQGWYRERRDTGDLEPELDRLLVRIEEELEP